MNEHVLGDFVHTERQRLGLNQRELARRSSVAQSALSRIENGKQDISVNQVRSIATVLGMKASEMLARIGE
jgi:hypothetical protein